MIDTANPAHLKSVLDEYSATPDKYAGKWLTDDARGLLNAYQKLKPDDTRPLPASSPWKTRGDRAKEVREIISDPKRTNQVVTTRTGAEATRAANKVGKAKRKIPPIVRGPLRYGPPPLSERGAYPGSLNNPGNVEKRAVRRVGEIDSPHERWAKFATPQDGLREAADVVRQIADVKLAEAGLPFTIRNWANVYAPERNKKGKKENDTEKYVRDISSTSGIDADATLDRRNGDEMSRLLKTIIRYESGVPHSEWFTDDEYRRAARAMNRDPESAPSLPATPDMSAPGGSTQTSEEAWHG
jgi:uncharacterized protein with PIN domain